MAKKKFSKCKIMIIAGIIVLAVIAAVLVAAYYAGWLGGDKTVAKVNDAKITQSELDTQYELFFTLVQYPDSYKEQITKKVYLNQMVVEELLIEEAKKIEISPSLVTSSELKAALDNYLYLNGMTIENLVQNIVEKNLTTDDLTAYFNKQIAISDFLNKTMLSSIEVTDKDIEVFYNENIGSFKAQEGQIRARHILVATEAEANEVVEKLSNGADFAALAKEVSLDTSSGANGGELRFFNKTDVVKEFADAAFSLKLWEISAPVKTDFGWHVIQRESNTIALNDIKDALELNILQDKQRTALQTYVEQLKANATIKIMIE
jgi:foldase protein PrsA